MKTGVEAHPLSWPLSVPRTRIRRRSRFKTSVAKARDSLMREVGHIGGRHVVLSTNIPTRLDGLPYANQAQPSDPGVAIYFERRGRQLVFACDRWDRVEDNMLAIQKTIKALRGIEDWGATEMMEQAFTGFLALPAPTPPKSWWEILGVDPKASRDEIERAFKRGAKEAHPDAGGSTERMAELNRARDEALRAAA